MYFMLHNITVVFIPCLLESVSVDGIFLEWGTWGECDVTCEGGLQWRDRVCEGPFYGGADCEGPRNDSQSCNTQECPGKYCHFYAWQMKPCFVAFIVQNMS